MISTNQNGQSYINEKTKTVIWIKRRIGHPTSEYFTNIPFAHFHASLEDSEKDVL